MEGREQCVAFTGHRSYRGEQEAALKEVIRRLYGEGYTYFLSGMAAGFDLAAAEAVLALRAELGIRLCCVIPYAGQRGGLPKGDQGRYDRVLEEADEVVQLAEGYFRGCFHKRNDFLVDHASCVVAYYNSPKGGTHYTVQRALKRGLSLINIYPLGVCVENDKELKLL
uniref:SLOG family protein n=1 Tax=Alistipes sp. TaxID=1872444 RepID=UPI004055A109